MNKNIFLVFATCLLISCNRTPKAEVRFLDGTTATFSDWLADLYYTGDTVYLKKENGEWKETHNRKRDTSFRCYNLTNNGDTVGFKLTYKMGIIVATTKRK